MSWASLKSCPHPSRALLPGQECQQINRAVPDGGTTMAGCPSPQEHPSRPEHLPFGSGWYLLDGWDCWCLAACLNMLVALQ